MTMRGRPVTQENKPKFHWLHSALKSIFSEQYDRWHSLSSITSVSIDWAIKDMSQGIRINILFFKIKAAPWKRVKKLK